MGTGLQFAVFVAVSDCGGPSQGREFESLNKAGRMRRNWRDIATIRRRRYENIEKRLPARLCNI